MDGRTTGWVDARATRHAPSLATAGRGRVLVAGRVAGPGCAGVALWCRVRHIGGCAAAVKGEVILQAFLTVATIMVGRACMHVQSMYFARADRF